MRDGTPAEFSADALTPFMAIEALFDSGTLRLWGGYGDLEIDGETYLGGGSLLSISGVEESSKIEARGANVVLSGLDPAIIAIALQENYQNRACRIIIGTLDESANVNASYTLLRGRIDQLSIEESGESAAIAVAIENRLIDLNRPRISRYTDEDQRALYPDDTGFSYVNDLQEKTVEWGR